MFKKVDSGFKDRVYDLVSKIPKGTLVSYGQIAEACGIKGAAYQVGQIAHTGPSELPWHRVVNAKGGLASGYPGGKYGHRKDLEKDGYVVSDDFVVDIDALRWDV